MILFTPRFFNSSTCEGSVSSDPRNKKFGKIIETVNVGNASDSVDGISGCTVMGEDDNVLSRSNTVEIVMAFELDPHPKVCECPYNAGKALIGLENVVGVPGVCDDVGFESRLPFPLSNPP